ncbi:hypothetical protein QFC22_003966 [Naganishia vaughanmartiniae]|uniref:Uncharacterized protein n=1 Tax=Naganishia vaughanmartiniae TaxID=1424756 RepID=A0ACC2X578_9TREE|nr:hypothetical protein QFC22_003966 [Naganishia vaughanmartiniae]
MFNDISIQQPGQYALRFRCFDLTEASDTPIEEEAVVTAPTEQGRDTVLVPGEDLSGTTSGDYSRGPRPMDVDVEGEDVKPFAGSHECASPLPTTQTTTATTTAKEQNAATAAKTEARALCEVVSDQFTVWGGKG